MNLLNMADKQSFIQAETEIATLSNTDLSQILGGQDAPNAPIELPSNPTPVIPSPPPQDYRSGLDRILKILYPMGLPPKQ